MFQTCECNEADASEGHGAQYESVPVGSAVATVRLAEAERRRDGPLVADCQGGNRSQRWKCRLNLVAKANFSPPSCHAREKQEGGGGEIPTSPSLVYSFECLSIICLSICRSHLSSCAGGQAEEDLSKMEQGAPMAASAGGRGVGGWEAWDDSSTDGKARCTAGQSSDSHAQGRRSASQYRPPGKRHRAPPACPPPPSYQQTPPQRQVRAKSRRPSLQAS